MLALKSDVVLQGAAPSSRVTSKTDGTASISIENQCFTLVYVVSAKGFTFFAFLFLFQIWKWWDLVRLVHILEILRILHKWIILVILNNHWVLERILNVHIERLLDSVVVSWGLQCLQHLWISQFSTWSLNWFRVFNLVSSLKISVERSILSIGLIIIDSFVNVI